MKLRKHQEECLEALRQEWKKGTRHILIAMACGAGKTVIFSEIANRAKNLRILILVDRIKLAEQASDYLEDHGVICASLNRREFNKRVTVASMQSIKEGDYDLIIADEVHGLNTKKILEKFTYTRLIGFTATPFKGSGRPIYGKGKFFSHLTYEKSSLELTDEGWLVPIVFKDTGESKFKTDKIRSNSDDYLVGELNSLVMSDLEKIRDQVQDALERSKNRKKVAFICVNIDHAAYVHSLLPKGSALLKHSKIKTDLKEFEQGSMKYLVSVMQVSTGYDYPPLDCIVMMRPTRSPVLYVQVAGRVQRTSLGKENGLFLDYGNVVENLGLIYDIQLNKKDPPVKICIDCETITSTSTAVCEECGYRFQTPCDVCGKMKYYGEVCCKKERNFDPVGKLDICPYGGLTWYRVTGVTSRRIRSKEGKKFIQFTYYLEGATAATEVRPYFTDGHYHELSKSIPPKRITIKKNGKYRNAGMKEY